MQPWMIDAALTLVILGITYALYSEGLWGSAVMFFNVLFAFLIAMNFYETLAALIVENVSAIADFADIICLGGLFLVSVIIFRSITGAIAPKKVKFPPIVETLGRIAFAAGTAILTAGVSLLIFYTAPVPRSTVTKISEAKPVYGMEIDRKLLAFFQHVTGAVFPTYGAGAADPEYGTAKVFDPNDAWLSIHQTLGAGAPPAAAAPPVDAGAGGQPMPGPQPGGEGMGIPGGTAGAAAGLAPQFDR